MFQYAKVMNVVMPRFESVIQNYALFFFIQMGSSHLINVSLVVMSTSLRHCRDVLFLLFVFAGCLIEEVASLTTPSPKYFSITLQLLKTAPTVGWPEEHLVLSPQILDQLQDHSVGKHCSLEHFLLSEEDRLQISIHENSTLGWICSVF